MATSCTINPQVRSKKTGELVNSKLFSDMKRAVGYDNARKAYLKVREEDFINGAGFSLQTDENGEYTFESLKSVPELAPLLGIRIRRAKAAEDSGAYVPVVATRDSIHEAEDKAVVYNSKPGNEFIALPEVYSDNTGTDIVRVVLVGNTQDNMEKASRISRARELVSRLRDVINRLGVEPDVIYDIIDRLREDGLDTYDASLSIAENLRDFIDKSSGGESNVTLPDELANIVFSSIIGNPLLNRLISNIINMDLASSIMTEDELDSVIESVGDDDYAIAEVAAKMIISAYIINGEISDIESDSEVASISNLLRRIKNDVGDIFSAIDKSEIDSYIHEAKLTPRVRSVESDMDNVETITVNQEVSEEEVNSVKKNADKQRALLHDIIETNVRRYKILSSRDTGYDKDFDKALTHGLYSRFEQEEYELGIYDFINASLEQLLNAREKMNDIRSDTSLSLERKAALLKSVKDFIQSYKISLDAIKQAEYAGYLKPDKTMDDVIDQVSVLIGRMMADYENQKNPLLLAFVRRFVGEGITVPFGKEKGKVYTAEDIINMAEKDISVFDRWLDSMAESGDMLLRMLDNTAKQARGAARLKTIEYKKRIDGIYNRLVKSGIRDTSFMFEKDPNGHKTGRYISADAASRLDKARRNYYNDMMALKKELDALLPDGATSLHNIIRIRKDYIERLKSQDSISGVMKETKEALRDKVKRRSDNAETDGSGETTKTVLMDFSGRQVEILPIMFVNSKDGENIDDISEDMTSAILMYANMASNYSAMSNVVGLLELVREKVAERPVQQRAGSKALVNVLNAFGLSVETELTKSGESTNIVKRMNDWFSSQVYSRYMKDEGEILGMDVGMLANLSNEVTALNQFALNILSGISNVMTASAMNRIETICGQYASMEDYFKANTIYWKALPEFLAEVGKPVKNSKLALFLEKFNVLQDFESDVRGQEYGRSRLSRLVNTNSLYVINNAGELWIQTIIALETTMRLGIKTKDGEPVSLWDALEVVTDDNGVSRLNVKKGIIKPDGSEFGSDKDILKIERRMKSINQRCNGIYNYEDRCAAQAYSWGRMALMFRKWIKPSLNRRYSSVNYNFDIEEWEEGFYNTAGRFFMQLVKDLRRGQLDIVTSYKNLDPREKANLMRFAVEVGQFVSVCAAFSILKDVKKKKDDDGDDIANSWWFNQLLYQTRRLESEIGAQMIINPQMIQEAFNILKSPAACVSTWEGVTNLTQLMIPSNYTKTLQTGRYKGHTKAYKLFWDSPLIPMHRTIYRGLHPQNSLQFYDL